MSWVLNNLGMLHTDLEKYQEAEQYFLRALDIARNQKDLHTQALLESNLAEVYIRLEQWSDAELHVSGTLAIAAERGDPLRRADGLKFLGMIQRAKGELAMATETLIQSHRLAEESEDVLLAAEAARELGETHAQAKEFESAREFFERANRLFTEMNAGRDATAVQERLDQVRSEAQ
jgi:tetratricopeptide (TPR) repeat protein